MWCDVKGQLSGNSCVLPYLLVICQMRRWISMIASGRTSTSPPELSRCFSGSFQSLCSHTDPSMTLWMPSVSYTVKIVPLSIFRLNLCLVWPQGGTASMCFRWFCFSSSECSDYKQRVNSIKDLIKKLPKPNHDTMQILFKHLRR